MPIKFFEHYGHFCAAYAVEVIVCFWTMVVGAITLNVSSPYELCTWALNCSNEIEETTSDVVLLTLLRCGTILFIYYQLKKVWKFGSLFVAGVLCIYTVFSVITFTITVVHFLRKDLIMVSSALPVFLLVSDISPILLLTQHCLTVKSIENLHHFIADGMEALMPIVTFDSIMQLLLLTNIGGYFQIRQLQQLSCFACLSVIINYIVFSTFVPACLSLFLTISNKNSVDSDQSKPSWYDVRFHNILQKEQIRNKLLSNKKKLFICFGLMILHVLRISAFPHYFSSKAEIMQTSFDSILKLTPEQLFTAALILIMCSKYLFDDYEIVAKLRRKSGEILQPVKMPVDQIHLEPLEMSESSDSSVDENSIDEKRTPEVCMQLLEIGSDLLTDEEILSLVHLGKIPAYKLESVLQDANRGVLIRRKLFQAEFQKEKEVDGLAHVPYDSYDFTTATKACCENTVGYIPIPVGLVGPLLLNDQRYKVPMATTEGTLLASTNRGMKALYKAGGVKATVYDDGMTRAPVVRFPSVKRCVDMAMWLKDKYNFNLVKEKFDETSRFAKLQEIKPIVSGRLLFIRFTAFTGDAMGMNMVSKGAENALRWLHHHFNDMEVISLSGNLCTDKKPSAVNWIEGRGKSVVCEAVLPHDVVKGVLRTSINSLIQLNHSKNHIGSAMAGSVGGFNAHAANIVTAVFIATGQDPAQNVVSSNCITTLQSITDQQEEDGVNSNRSLLVTCTMPSLEVATVGGGAALEPQKACLNILGVAGSSSPDKRPGENARHLAEIICATVLAGELSLLAALSTGDLVQSHMKHNRLKPTVKQKSDHSIL